MTSSSGEGGEEGTARAEPLLTLPPAQAQVILMGTFHGIELSVSFVSPLLIRPMIDNLNNSSISVGLLLLSWPYHLQDVGSHGTVRWHRLIYRTIILKFLPIKKFIANFS